MLVDQKKFRRIVSRARRMMSKQSDEPAYWQGALGPDLKGHICICCRVDHDEGLVHLSVYVSDEKFTVSVDETDANQLNASVSLQGEITSIQTYTVYCRSTGFHASRIASMAFGSDEIESAIRQSIEQFELALATRVLSGM